MSFFPSVINTDVTLTFALISPVLFTEVIELSSGEDDALQIVDSSDSGNEGEEDGSEESSGSHVNDALNQSDALGQVIVNINHPPNEEDIFLAPQLAHAVKPHQVGSVRLGSPRNSGRPALLLQPNFFGDICDQSGCSCGQSDDEEKLKEGLGYV